MRRVCSSHVGGVRGSIESSRPRGNLPSSGSVTPQPAVLGKHPEPEIADKATM